MEVEQDGVPSSVNDGDVGEVNLTLAGRCAVRQDH